MNRRRTDTTEPMKIYEFTYENEDASDPADVKKRLRNFLEMEAHMQQWKRGFKLKLVGESVHPVKGHSVLHYEVFGGYDEQY